LLGSSSWLALGRLIPASSDGTSRGRRALFQRWMALRVCWRCPIRRGPNGWRGATGLAKRVRRLCDGDLTGPIAVCTPHD